MRVLGFDPSLTNFGWAIHDSSVSGAGRCVERGRFQTSTKTLFVDRYIQMRANVKALIKRVGIQRLGVEYPVFNELWSEGMYGLFLYTCEALREAQVDVVFFSPPQIKAHARDFLQRPTVGGKKWEMGKPDMVEAAIADTGGKGRWNHNEADAYWVARTASRFWALVDGDIVEADLTPTERKQFLDIHTFTRGKRVGQIVERGILYREDERFFQWAHPEVNDGDGEEGNEVGEAVRQADGEREGGPGEGAQG